MSVKANLAYIRERIQQTSERCGRDPADIELVVVTKTVSIDKMKEAIDCGVGIVGENRVHEASEKQAVLNRTVQWHMVGHLQSRKAMQAVALFDMVQSVDSISTARALQKRCSEIGKILPVLIEINTSYEEQKYGLTPADAESFIREVVAMENLRVEGLMTMAAFVPDPEQARPSFRRLRELAERLRRMSMGEADLRVLSMGMSNDFEVAIEEGATMLRIGSAVFEE